MVRNIGHEIDRRLEAGMVIKALPLNPGDYVLDAGCGDGSLTRALRFIAPTLHLTGIDKSLKMIEHCISLDQEKIQFVVGDLRDRITTPETFSAALLIGNTLGLDSGAHDREILLSIKDALKPSGRVLIALSSSTSVEAVFGQHRQAFQITDNGAYFNEASVSGGTLTGYFYFIDQMGTLHTQDEPELWHIYSEAEICKLLEDNGYKIIATYGSLENLEPHDVAASPELVVVAEKN